MALEISLVFVTGTAPASTLDIIASTLMEKQLCELASTSMPKSHGNAVIVRVDVPSNGETEETPVEYNYTLRYMWDMAADSALEEFLNYFLWYKNVLQSDRNFVSTRGVVSPTCFLTAIKEGLAADGGLFMPQQIPTMLRSQLVKYCESPSLSYNEAAQIILEQLVDSTISPTLLQQFIAKAYQRDHWSDLENICPLRPLLERQQRAGERWTRNVSMLELYHGPTAAFKDFALQLFPYYFQYSTMPNASFPVHSHPPTGSVADSLQAPMKAASTSAKPSVMAPKFDEGFLRTKGYVEFMRQQAATSYRIKNSHYLVLAATSGDTGVAAISGFQNLGSPAIKVAVLYPLHGVSPVQQLQMQSMDDGHCVRVIGVTSNFDFCQSTVKDIFNSTELKDQLAAIKPNPHFLSSANSINWGRLIPQVAYYFWCYRQLFQVSKQRKEGSLAESALVTSMVPNNFRFGFPMDVVVPCGNFGNILAGFIAKLMGLPIRKLVVASNENDVLYEFIQTGRYTIASRTLTTTASPSIDILVASNVERFLHLLSGGDAALVSSLMHQLETKKSFTLPDHLRECMQRTFWAGRCTEKECGKVIYDIFEASRGQRLLDTHTAVAVAVAQKYREEMLSREEQGNPMELEAENDKSRVGMAPSKRKHAEKRGKSSPGTGNGGASPLQGSTSSSFPTLSSGVSVLEVPLVVVSTAHWSKFPDAVCNALQSRPLQERSTSVHSSMSGSSSASSSGEPATSEAEGGEMLPNASEEKGVTVIHKNITPSEDRGSLHDVIAHTLFCYLQIERLSKSRHFSVPQTHPALRRMLDALYKPFLLTVGSTSGSSAGSNVITTSTTGASSTSVELRKREVTADKEKIVAEVVDFCSQPPVQRSSSRAASRAFPRL